MKLILLIILAVLGYFLKDKFFPKGKSKSTEKEILEEFNNTLDDGLRHCKKEIDITIFAKSVTDGGYGWEIPNITSAYEDFIWNNPEIFHIGKAYRYSIAKQFNKIIKFCLTGFLFEMNAKQYSEALIKLRHERDCALKLISNCKTPEEIIKYLHDYLIRKCEYAHYATKDTSMSARTAYSALVNHEALCEGYAMAYCYLLKSVGIDCRCLISKDMNHCWNYVNIGENWYHVDVTWDDPTYEGKNPDTAPIHYDHFLLSDNAILAKEYHGWDVQGLPPANDTTYDRKKWI